MATPKRVIIIGAGWNGIAAAKTYLRVNPAVDLKILDADSSVGGVWSASRIYPGLVADSPVGLFEYSDKTMIDAEHPAWSTVTGDDVHAYLQKYVEDAGLLRHIHFNTTVTKIIREKRGWRLTTATDETFDCDRLIVATGLDSRPNWPNVSNDGFEGPVIHSVSLGVDHAKLTSADIDSVAVVGGCKSAIEAANICLNAGKQVYWLIREDGSGAGPLLVMKRDRKIHIGKINNSRLFSMMSPSVYNTEGFWYQFLHSGRWKTGTKAIDKFWRTASEKAFKDAEYGKSLNSDKIRPEIEDLRWTTASAGLLWSDSPFLPILHAEKEIFVQRATPARLDKDGMHLTDGTVLPVNAVVYATGWDHNTSLFTPADTLKLGLPVPLSQEPKAAAAYWESLTSVADADICKKFPYLANQPPHNIKKSDHTPHRLFRNIIAPNMLTRRDRSITFLGLLASTQTATMSEISALWAVAWMENLMPPNFPPPQKELTAAVARFNCWMWRRYMSSRGINRPVVTVEVQTLFDKLMRDMGLKAERKRKGMIGIFKEYVTPYKTSDYNGIVDELLARVQREKEREEKELKAGRRPSIARRTSTMISRASIMSF